MKLKKKKRWTLEDTRYQSVSISNEFFASFDSSTTPVDGACLISPNAAGFNEQSLQAFREIVPTKRHGCDLYRKPIKPDACRAHKVARAELERACPSSASLLFTGSLATAKRIVWKWLRRDTDC